jgi:acetyltransferase-like isoleucine patch superfamily enzyme
MAVLYGVMIGDGAVVRAGAVVTRDIPTLGIAVGVSAKTVRFRS